MDCENCAKCPATEKTCRLPNGGGPEGCPTRTQRLAKVRIGTPEEGPG